MPPDKIFIDEKWLKSAPKPAKDMTSRHDKYHYYRDTSLAGFGIHVYADGSAKALINARFLGEKNPRKRDLGYITKSRPTEVIRLLVKDIKEHWSRGEEHPELAQAVSADLKSLANKVKEILEQAPELREADQKLLLLENKQITVFKPKVTGKIKSAIIKPIYSRDGKGVQSKTVKNYFTYWNNHVYNFKYLPPDARKNSKGQSINRVKINDITPDMMRQLHKHITDKGQLVNADKVLGWLRACFETWKLSGKSNPVISALSADTGLYAKSKGSIWNRPEVVEENIHLEPKQIGKIKKVIFKRLEKTRAKNNVGPRESKETRTMVLLLTAIYTGGRFDWVCSLTWDQLNKASKNPRTSKPDFIDVLTKQRWFKKIITKELVTTIKSYVQRDEDIDYIFWSKDSAVDFIVDYIKLWKGLLKEAKVPYCKPKSVRKHYNDTMKSMGIEETSRKIAMTQSATGINEKFYSNNFNSQYKIELSVHNQIDKL